jgi:hypothetical protein
LWKKGSRERRRRKERDRRNRRTIEMGEFRTQE